VNEKIREKEVRLIDEHGGNIGVVPISKGLALARERGLDLVEVAPQANPSVCRVMDFGKYQYQQEKKQRKGKQRSRLKEMKFTIKIEEHDFNTKMRRVRTFLEKGHPVRVSIFFRGREIVHKDRGHTLLQRVADQVSEIAKVDGRPKAKGKVLQMLLVPDNQRTGG